MKSVTSVALHFETGYCPSCPGASNARRSADEVVRSGGANFLTQPLRITAGGESVGGYSEDGYNYKCNACGKEFKKLGSMMQHQQSRPQCSPAGQIPSLRQIAYR